MKPKGKEVNEDEDKAPLSMTTEGGYDPKKSKEVKSLIKQGIRYFGLIKELTDGHLYDFIDEKNALAWEPLDRRAFEIKIEIELEDEKKEQKPISIRKIFVYELDTEGKVIVHEKSNLAKFKKAYETLPEEGLKVVCEANREGFLRLVL